MKRLRWPRILGGFLYFAFIVYLVLGIYQDFVLLAPRSFVSDQEQRIVFGVSLVEQDSSTILSEIEGSKNENNWSTSFLLQSQSPIVQLFLDYVAIYDDIDIPAKVCFKTIHLSKNDKVPLQMLFTSGSSDPMGALTDSDEEFIFTLKKEQCLDKGEKYFLPHLFLGSITVDAYSDLGVARINGFHSFDFFPFDEQKIQLDMAISRANEDERVIPRVEATISTKGWIGGFERDANQKTILHLQRPDFYKSILILFFAFMLPVILLLNNVVGETGSFFEVAFGLLLGLWGTHEILTPKYIESSIPIDFAIYVLYTLVIGEIFLVLLDRFSSLWLKRKVHISKLEVGRSALAGQPAQDEYIEITNPTPFPIDMTNWLLYDKDANKFKFPAYVLKGRKSVLGAPGKVTIWTKAGINDSENLFWGRRSNNVWNQFEECAYLEDSIGELISIYSSAALLPGADHPSPPHQPSRPSQSSQPPNS